jgi:hypothetical protein
MDKVWPNLPEHESHQIDALAEEYDSLEDYWKQTALTTGARIALETHFAARALYRERIDTELDSLYGAEAQQMFCDSAYAKRRIGEVMARIKGLLHVSFGLGMAPGRPVDRETEDRHRYWSRLQYQGSSWNEIVADEAERGAVGRNKDHIRTAVEEYRQRREPIQRILRWLIFADRGGGKHLISTTRSKSDLRLLSNCTSGNEEAHSSTKEAHESSNFSAAGRFLSNPGSGCRTSRIKPRQLEFWRYKKRGPGYRRFARLIRYALKDLQAFADAGLVETTNNRPEAAA